MSFAHPYDVSTTNNKTAHRLNLKKNNIDDDDEDMMTMTIQGYLSEYPQTADGLE